jgi:hypothetical protein
MYTFSPFRQVWRRILVDAVLLPRHDYLGLFWRDMRQEDATPESRSQALQLSQAEGLDVLRHHPFFEVSCRAHISCFITMNLVFSFALSCFFRFPRVLSLKPCSAY